MSGLRKIFERIGFGSPQDKPRHREEVMSPAKNGRTAGHDSDLADVRKRQAVVRRRLEQLEGNGVYTGGSR